LPMWRVGLWRHGEVRRFLQEIPIRHPEKTAKAKIALQLDFKPDYRERERTLSEWNSLKCRIRADVLEYIRKAGEEFNRRRKEN